MAPLGGMRMPRNPNAQLEVKSKQMASVQEAVDVYWELDCESMESVPSLRRQPSAALVSKRGVYQQPFSFESLPWRVFKAIFWSPGWLLERLLPVQLPDNPLRKCWTFWTLAIVLYAAVDVPLQIAFTSWHRVKAVQVLSLLTSVSFCFDVVIHFRTAYITAQGELVRLPSLITINYLRGMFAFDFVSALPLDEVFRNTSFASHAVWLGLLKLPRLFHLARHFNTIMRTKYMNILGVARLLAIMLLITHWSACLWHYLYEALPGWPWVLSVQCIRCSHLESYLFSFYRCFLLILGDRPDLFNNVERILAVTLLSLGACLYAVVVSSITMLISNMWGMASRHKQRSAMLQDALRYKGATMDVRVRMDDYYNFMAKYDHPGPDGVSFLSELPAALHAELLASVFERMLVKVQLFSYCERPFIWRLSQRLRLSLFMTKDVIYEQGGVGHDMYIIWKGAVALVGSDGGMTALLTDNDHFGELGLMTAITPRPHRAVAVRQCDIMMLGVWDLQDVMRDFPDSAQMVKGRARVQLEDHEAGPALWAVSLAAGTAPRHELHPPIATASFSQQQQDLASTTTAARSAVEAFWPRDNEDICRGECQQPDVHVAYSSAGFPTHSSGESVTLSGVSTTSRWKLLRWLNSSGREGPAVGAANRNTTGRGGGAVAEATETAVAGTHWTPTLYVDLTTVQSPPDSPQSCASSSTRGMLEPLHDTATPAIITADSTGRSHGKAAGRVVDSQTTLMEHSYVTHGLPLRDQARPLLLNRMQQHQHHQLNLPGAPLPDRPLEFCKSSRNRVQLEDELQGGPVGSSEPQQTASGRRFSARLPTSAVSRLPAGLLEQSIPSSLAGSPKQGSYTSSRPPACSLSNRSLQSDPRVPANARGSLQGYRLRSDSLLWIYRAGGDGSVGSARARGDSSIRSARDSGVDLATQGSRLAGGDDCSVRSFLAGGDVSVHSSTTGGGGGSVRGCRTGGGDTSVHSQRPPGGGSPSRSGYLTGRESSSLVFKRNSEGSYRGLETSGSRGFRYWGLMDGSGGGGGVDGNEAGSGVAGRTGTGTGTLRQNQRQVTKRHERLSSGGDGCLDVLPSEGLRAPVAVNMLMLQGQPWLGLDPLGPQLNDAAKKATAAAAAAALVSSSEHHHVHMDLRRRLNITKAESASSLRLRLPFSTATGDHNWTHENVRPANGISSLSRGVRGSSFLHKRTAGGSPARSASARARRTSDGSVVSDVMLLAQHSYPALGKDACMHGDSGPWIFRDARVAALERQLKEALWQLKQTQQELAAVYDNPMQVPAFTVVLRRETAAVAARIEAQMAAHLRGLLEMLHTTSVRLEDLSQQISHADDRLQRMESSDDISFHTPPHTTGTSLSTLAAGLASAGACIPDTMDVDDGEPDGMQSPPPLLLPLPSPSTASGSRSAMDAAGRMTLSRQLAVRPSFRMSGFDASTNMDFGSMVNSPISAGAVSPEVQASPIMSFEDVALLAATVQRAVGSTSHRRRSALEMSLLSYSSLAAAAATAAAGQQQHPAVVSTRSFFQRHNIEAEVSVRDAGDRGSVSGGSALSKLTTTGNGVESPPPLSTSAYLRSMSLTTRDRRVKSARASQPALVSEGAAASSSSDVLTAPAGIGPHDLDGALSGNGNADLPHRNGSSSSSKGGFIVGNAMAVHENGNGNGSSFSPELHVVGKSLEVPVETALGSASLCAVLSAGHDKGYSSGSVLTVNEGCAPSPSAAVAAVAVPSVAAAADCQVGSSFRGISGDSLRQGGASGIGGLLGVGSSRDGVRGRGITLSEEINVQQKQQELVQVTTAGPATATMRRRRSALRDAASEPGGAACVCIDNGSGGAKDGSAPQEPTSAPPRPPPLLSRPPQQQQQ